MRRFLSQRFAALEPYVPGEQPQDRSYVKLNTNESPYPPSPAVIAAVAEAAGQCQRYPDPECMGFRRALAELFGVGPENILPANGSDEALNFIFAAYGDETHPFAFPNFTYGFYPVFCRMNHVPYTEFPLRPDFTVDPADYLGTKAHVVLANPNAPTGIALSPETIEALVRSDPERIVVVDEAYVDFGGESCVPLTKRYDNLLVVQTFSKSRSLAGARLGFAVGAAERIAELNTLRYSTNPYNLSRMALAAGEAALADNDYDMANCRRIMETRERTAAALEALGFRVLPSSANFLFASTPDCGGRALYQALKDRGVLVRQFEKPGISDFIRVTVGSPEQMERFLQETEEILRGKLPPKES